MIVTNIIKRFGAIRDNYPAVIHDRDTRNIVDVVGLLGFEEVKNGALQNTSSVNVDSIGTDANRGLAHRLAWKSDGILLEMSADRGTTKLDQKTLSVIKVANVLII